MRKSEMILWVVVILSILAASTLMLNKAFAFDICQDDGIFTITNLPSEGWAVGGTEDGEIVEGDNSITVSGSVIEFWFYNYEINAWDRLFLSAQYAEGISPYPSCHGEDEWQPGAPSVPVTLLYDCNQLEVKDPYGNWSLVTSDGEPVQLKYGEALIASPYGQTINPDDYRAIPCS